MGRYRWAMVGGIVVLCGCVALSRLFEEKPKTVAGGSGSLGSGSGGDVFVPTPPNHKPRIVLGKIYDRYPFPTGTPIGSWVTLRITRPAHAAVEETWAVIGGDGDKLWIEHTDSPQGRGLIQVSCYLVAPDGLISLAVRGRPGEEPGTLEPSSDAASDPGFYETLLAGVPTGRAETVNVEAGTFECQVVDLDDGEGTAWVAEGVPFHGLVRILYGKDPAERHIIELVALGRDRTTTQLAGALPRRGTGSGS